MTDIQYSLYKTTLNGQTYFDVLPNTNTPYGYEPATLQDVQQVAKDKITQMQQLLQNPGGTNTQYLAYAQQFANLDPNALTADQVSQITGIKQSQLSQIGLPTGQVLGPITATNSSGIYSSAEAAKYAAENPQTPNQGTGGLTVPPNPLGGSTTGGTGTGGTSGTPGTSGSNTGTPGASGGTSGTTSGQQIYRDNNNNFFTVNPDGTKTPMTLDQFHQLGINETFVKAGQTVSLQQAQTGQVGGTTTTFDPTKYGITAYQWSKLDPGTQAFVESVAKTVQGQYDAGLTNISVNADLLNKAMAAAQNDPDIKAKYGDALKTAQGDVQRNLSFINAEYAQQQGQLSVQQQEERKALAEQMSQSGLAYSGYRAQARERLATEQSGVIESSRRQLQDQINKIGGSLESAYGTAGLGQFGNISAGGLAYNPYGGITGSVPLAQKADIYSRGLQEYQMVKPA